MKTNVFILLLLLNCIFLGCQNTNDNSKTESLNQIWMSKNLNTAYFQNGDTIPEVKTNEEWIQALNDKKPAWCYIDNDSKKGEKFGKLYNWFAVNDKRGLAPKGWHIPTKDEWLVLVNYLGGKNIAGEKLKSKQGWDIEGNGTDVINFNGLPVGFRNGEKGDFDNLGSLAMFWTKTEFNEKDAFFMNLDYGTSDCDYMMGPKNYGFSVRCVKN